MPEKEEEKVVSKGKETSREMKRRRVEKEKGGEGRG